MIAKSESNLFKAELQKQQIQSNTPKNIALSIGHRKLQFIKDNDLQPAITIIFKKVKILHLELKII